MIIFATHHDESTAESIKLAKSIITEKDIVLLEDMAIRPYLLSVLETQREEQLMIFSHGKANYCLGNDDIPAFTTEDIALLARRKVFVYACWTAVGFGKIASSQLDCLYAGYNNSVITGGSEIPDEMQKIFQFIKNNFHSSQNPEDIVIFLEKLSELCNHTEQTYLERYPESLDYIGISTTLRNIWAKLEIWFASQKYAHRDAIEPPLW
jgi:hypothetical protein